MEETRPETVTVALPAARAATRTVRPRPWNVVLTDSEDHTHAYVIEMMVRVFGHSLEASAMIAKTVDVQGRAVCCTTHRERAELKLEQVLGYGADPRVMSCAGSMSAHLEPADAGDGDDAGD